YFQYERNKLYQQEISISDNHTYFDNMDEKYIQDNWLELGELISIEEGFHFAETKERLQQTIDHYLMNNVEIFTCIIPAGSEYYAGFTDLAAANQIIIL